MVEPVLDALIVGAGFSGIYMLYKLQTLNFKVKIYESGSGVGGTWYWNRYPGARVDCDHQIYQFRDSELWKGFQFTERFPSQPEVKAYFEYVVDRLDLAKNIEFNTHVISAKWDNARHQWLVETDGATTWTSHLILCTGSAWKTYIPPFKGLESFQGQSFHTSDWPKNEDFNVAGKRVAVIGTGASGVQVIQESGPIAGHLTVYQRTPNLCLPMQQYSAEEEHKWKCLSQPEVFAKALTTLGGIPFDFKNKNMMEDNPEERRAVFESLYEKGGFNFWQGTYQDLLTSKEANDEAYKFWCEKSRARITNDAKKDLLAPLVPPHAFGTKRPSLEQRYFEVCDQDNVDIINIRESSIIEITPTGILTEKEGLREFDVIILATGFDFITGGICNIDIKNEAGISIKEKWVNNGVRTNLGMTTAGFPNLYFTYGPQAPTSFSNGPTTAGIQTDWIKNLLVNMRDWEKKKIEAIVEAEENWTRDVLDMWNSTLFPGTESWYQGCNIPGKRKEPLNYLGGIPTYLSILEECTKNGYPGFVLE